jgi:hypothetical protein
MNRREFVAASAALSVIPMSRGPVLRNVKVLGIVSTNGHEYSVEAMSDVVRLAEGMEVRFNPVRTKEVELVDGSRIGSVHGLYQTTDGVYAREFVLDKTIDIPRGNGLGLDLMARLSHPRNHLKRVDKVTEVNQIHLLCDPATTKGLYS